MAEIVSIPRVTDVKPLDGQRIWLRFEDGCAGEVDLAAGDFLDDQPELLDLLNDRKFFEQIAWREDSYLGWSSQHWVEGIELYAFLNGRTLREQLGLLDAERDPLDRPLRLVEVEALSDYRLRLQYSNGVSGIVDMSHLVGTGLFELWNDPAEFEKVRISKFGDYLYWNEQIDSCALHLYERITGVDAHGFGTSDPVAMSAD